MTTHELDNWLKETLQMDKFPFDHSLNGLQVGNPDKTIQKIALAVDACMASFDLAIAQKADLLLVHHGLFWGAPIPVITQHYKRLKKLIAHDLGVYAVHLPLDAHPLYGNNAGLAEQLDLQALEPFGTYKGLKLGFKGKLPAPLSLDEIVFLTCGPWSSSARRLPFGKEKIQTVGIVSGGAPFSVTEALEENLDLFITGDASHNIYHTALEGKINVLFAGHYATETLGVKRIGKQIQKKFDIETFFVDVPTQL